MNRSKLNYIIDVALAVSFLITFLTGIIKWPGLITNIGLSYQQIPYQKISQAHDYWGLIMGILVFIHLIVHWKWITSMTKKILKKSK
jgi:membrane protein DedA with SNARE-associated domain